MTPTEIYEEAQKLAAEIDVPLAKVSLSFDSNRSGDRMIHGVVWVGGDIRGMVFGDNVQDVVAGLREKWATYADRHAADMTEKLALEIIRLTALQGECTDAALRGSGFNAADVSRYGHDACTRADEMAQNGPFSITALRGANAA